jgi:NAD(P)-dependent dehydrogenase (short-subunit alcohol dehydrogenase family)
VEKSAYVASKHGVIGKCYRTRLYRLPSPQSSRQIIVHLLCVLVPYVGLTKVTALENAKTGVTCNAICPGWVLTPLVCKNGAVLYRCIKGAGWLGC